MCGHFVVFFLCKQKTAYEMRISDWSSDVCSSDLSLAMERKVEEAVIKIPKVALMFSKTGTAEVASDPMPPNVSDGFVILKEKDQWAEGTTKADVVAKDRKSVV